MVYSYLKGWLKTPETHVNTFLQLDYKITILVAARNEEKKIANCLKSLTNQSYAIDKYEIIVLDDFSEDNTVMIANKYENVTILKLSDYLDKKYQNLANKKRAITLGIQQAKNNIIITTDGDCVYGKNWLESMVQHFHNTNAKLIAGPVTFNTQNGLFHKFLELDLISLAGITAGSIKNKRANMVNGANLMFEKITFSAVKGYLGNENIPSGDDVFLMEKINAKYSNAISFVKNFDTIVYTDAPKNFKNFLNQRIRWSSKTVNHANNTIKVELILHYLFYLLLFTNLFVLPFFKPFFLFLGTGMLFFKILIDILLFHNLLIFFKQKKLINYLYFIELIHLVYIPILGVLSLLCNYSWKGRKV